MKPRDLWRQVFRLKFLKSRKDMMTQTTNLKHGENIQVKKGWINRENKQNYSARDPFDSHRVIHMQKSRSTLIKG